MLQEEELGASFLITLKHRSVIDGDGASQCLADMLEPIECQQDPGTKSMCVKVSKKDLAERKNHCGEEVRSTLEKIRGTRNTSPPPGSLPGEGSLLLPPPSQSPNTPGRQQYWAESARRAGLVDTPDGIRLAPPSPPDVQQGVVVVPSSEPVAFNKPGYATAPYSVESFQDAQGAAPTTTKKGKKHTASLVTPDMAAISAEQALEVPDLSLPSSLNSLMGDTALVSTEDMDLVPDYLFLAMAQMKPCVLSESDRVGCYKDRGVGFLGMSCKHCGGQPGFGKYFPATVRSLAQTTTSQTIIKHVGVKCRLCPSEVRNAVLALQRNSHDKPGCNYSRGPSSVSDGRPKYGSRKVFFQRVWGRLHGEAIPTIPDFEAQASLHAAAVATQEQQARLPATDHKNRARPHPEERQQRADQAQAQTATVTPNDSDATPSEQGDGDDDVSSLDGSSYSSSSSVAGVANARPSTQAALEEGSSSDGSLLTDNTNRRVTVRAGGSHVAGGRASTGSGAARSRQRPVLPTKASAKRKGTIAAAEDEDGVGKNNGSNKRVRQHLQ